MIRKKGSKWEVLSESGKPMGEYDTETEANDRLRAIEYYKRHDGAPDKRVLRFDLGTLGAIERTPQGGLRIPAFPTRAGVFIYRNPDGSQRRELRHPEEVFSEDSMASLKNAPITDLHPSSPVNPDTWQAVTVGHVGEDIGREGQHLSAPLLIQHGPTIAKVEAGERRELSCGYDCDLVSEPGVWEGHPYDARQTNIRYNHVAIGPRGWGRGGSTVSLRLDSGDAVQVDSDKIVCNNEGAQMPRMIRVDGIEYEAGSESHLQAVDRLVAKQAADLAAQTARADKAEGEVKTQTALANEHKTRADKAETDLKAARDPKALSEIIRRRVDALDLCRRVAKITGSRFDDADEEAAEGEDEDSMMLRIVKMIDPDFNPAGQDPKVIHGYAMGRIAALLESDVDGEGDEIENDDEAPGGHREQEVSGGVVPPAAPGRSDSRRRRDGGGLIGGVLGVFGARRVASREDGRGESVIRGEDAGARGARRNRENSVEAAERRNREDSQNAWQSPLHYSKDPAPAPKR